MYSNNVNHLYLTKPLDCPSYLGAVTQKWSTSPDLPVVLAINNIEYTNKNFDSGYVTHIKSELSAFFFFFAGKCKQTAPHDVTSVKHSTSVRNLGTNQKA